MSELLLPPEAETIEDIYELTSLQQVMLFSTLYAPESGVYFETVSTTLQGPFSLPAFTRAWQLVVDHHAVLRTSFHWEDLEKPVQVVHRRIELPVTELDWRDLPPAERDSRLSAFLAEDRRKGFALDEAPLMRLTFIQLSGSEWQFVWSFHHILLDGWSVQLVLKDVFEAYLTICRGQEPRLPLARPYGDYVAWVQEQDPMLAEQYWREILHDFAAPTRFGVDEMSSKDPELAGLSVEHRLWLNAETTARLSALARDHRLTLNTIVQGAWAILLSRCSGDSDVVFGTVVSGRPSALSGVESMVGMFINTLPVRTRVDPDAPLLPWLASLQSRQADARRFEYSDPILVQSASRVPPGTPLFESVLVFENYPIPEALKAQGGEGQEAHFIERTNLPLTLLFGLGRELLVRVLYDCERFDAATIGRLGEYYRALLDAIAIEAEQRIGDLPLVHSAAQRSDLPEPQTEEGHVPVVDLFRAQARATPDAPAFLFDDRTLSYAELDERSNRIANRLIAMGVGPESVVAVCLPPSLDVPACLLGILKAGGAYLPLEPSLPKARIRTALATAARALISCSDLAERSDTFSGPRLLLDADPLDDPASPNGTPSITDAAYVLFTSGSTGTPKAVVCEHRQLLNRLAWMWEEYPFFADDLCCQRTPLCFIDSLWELLGPLLKGVPTLIVPECMRHEPDAFVDLLAEHRVTRLWLVPSLLSTILATQYDLRHRLEKLRFWVATGEPLTTELRERFRQAMPTAKLYNLYGTTEIWDATWFDADEALAALPRVPIGRPIRNVTCLILDDRQRSVPIGIPGELYVGGAGLARGYLDASAAEEARSCWLANGASSQRLYRTGDLARLLPDGSIDCLGRADRQIKLRGHRIDLSEVEAALLSHPGIEEAAVTRFDDEAGEPRIVAYLVYRGEPNEDADETTLQALEQEQIPRWKEVWDDAYNRETFAIEPSLNTAGFTSSYTGEAIPAEEVREWAELAVSNVMAFEPRHVLEIGCGTGLLLLRIAPACDSYVGSDFSPAALDFLRPQAASAGLARVELLERAADDFDGLEPGRYDMIILHSVVQYFPSAGYLMKVLEGAVRCTAPGGIVYIGDVRSLRLLEAFHTSVEIQKAERALSVRDFRRLVDKRMLREKELVIDPALFAALKRVMPRISQVRISPKTGAFPNEFNRFRYDVFLHVETPDPLPAPAARIYWNPDGIGPGDVAMRLGEAACSLVLDVPDASVTAETALLKLVTEAACAAADNSDESIDVAEIRRRRFGLEAKGLSPAEFLQLSGAAGCDAMLALASQGSDASYNAICHCRPRGTPFFPRVGDPHAFAAVPARQRAWSHYTNNPLHGMFADRVIPRIREQLEQALPEVMRPTAYVLLDTLPRTSSGKVDYRSLPPPDMARTSLAVRYVAPRTELEQVTVDLWAEVLGSLQVGVHDNFFTDLGGHSLLATQVVSRLSALLSIPLTVRCLFDHPTVAELAAKISELQADTKDEERTDLHAVPRVDRSLYRLEAD